MKIKAQTAMMKSKAQTAMEYLLIVGAAILFVTIVIFIIRGNVFQTGIDDITGRASELASLKAKVSPP